MTSSPRLPAIGEMFTEVAPLGEPIHEVLYDAPAARESTLSQEPPIATGAEQSPAPLHELDPEASKAERERIADAMFDQLAQGRARRASSSPYAVFLNGQEDSAA